MYIRPGTALAAANDEDNIRIYLQDQAGMVNEGICNGFRWRNGIKLFKAKIGSPLAVAHEKLKQIRVYYLTDDNFLNEFVYEDNKGWVLGGLGQKGFQVSPFTKLAARWDDGKPHVYAQLTDDTIQEFGFTNPNGTWDKLHNFGKGLYNTSIAITPGGERLYYQLTQGDIVEKLYANGWGDGQFRYNFASWGCPIVAIASKFQRVYHLSSNNGLVESVISEMGPNSKCLNKEALVGSQLAILEYGNNIRIYLQDEKEGTTISEYGYYHQTGNWVPGYSVLPMNGNVLMSETNNSEL